MKRAIFWALMVAAAAVVHVICGRVLAGQDAVLALLVGGRVKVALIIVALLSARLFLFLLAPGWALYLLATALAARYARRA